MHTFAEKPTTHQQATSANLKTPSEAFFGQTSQPFFGQSREANFFFPLQRTIGSQAKQRMLQTDSEEPQADLTRPASPSISFDFNRIPVHAPAARAIQTKLAINKPGDEYEQEADQTADKVMRMPEPQLQRTCTCGGEYPERKTHQSNLKEERLQLKPFQPGSVGQTTAPPIVHEVLTSPGQPLDTSTRSFMEQRFGYDFSKVQVHTSERAAASAQAVNAIAYTTGNNVVFNKGQYSPGTNEGQQLIAHELTHVIQQQAARSVKTVGYSIPTLPHIKPSVRSTMILQREVNDPRKLQIVSKEAPRHVRVSEWLVENQGGVPARTELYWVDFEVDTKGVMRASVRTVSADRQYRSSTLRFKNEFRHALDHFENNGVQVSAFEGDWSYMSSDEISENLRVFREGVAEGLIREKAAQVTPTGRVLASEGFEVMHVENVLESQPHLAEEGLRRWRVKAVFRRPSIPSNAPVIPSGGVPSKPLPSVKAEATTAEGGISGEIGGPGRPELGPSGGGTATTTVEETTESIVKHAPTVPKSPIGSPFPGSGMPEPVLEPRPGIGARLKAAPRSFAEGLEGAFSAENIAAAIPEVVLAIADKVAAREAIRGIKTKFAKEGFAKGFAAGVTGWTKEEVHLNLKNRVTSFRVQGLEDPAGLLTREYILKLAESYENYAVDVGYQFSSSKTLNWKKDMTAKAWEVLAKYGYHFGGDPEVYIFEYDFIDKLAYALHPITDRIIEKAI